MNKDDKDKNIVEENVSTAPSKDKPELGTKVKQLSPMRDAMKANEQPSQKPKESSINPADSTKITNKHITKPVSPENSKVELQKIRNPPNTIVSSRVKKKSSTPMADVVAAEETVSSQDLDDSPASNKSESDTQHQIESNSFNNTTLVWRYYRRAPDYLAICTVCGEKVKRPSGSTWHMLVHLSTKHNVKITNKGKVDFELKFNRIRIHSSQFKKSLIMNTEVFEFI